MSPHASFQGGLRLQFSDLDNPIHPLLSSGNWIPVDEASGLRKDVTKPWHDLCVWLGIVEPALRLASLFISVDPLLPWWAHSFFGKHNFNFHAGERFLDPVSYTPAIVNGTRHKLESMALDLRISFTDNDEAVARMTECWRTAEGVQVEKKDLGELYQLHDGQWTPWNANKTEVEALIPVALIEIKEWYLDYGLSKFSEASSQHQATFLFGLAHTLGHELAHVAWFHAREQQRREVKTKAEPFHDIADPEAEWGWSWESRILPRYKDQPIIVNWADVGFHDAAMVWAPWVTPVGDGSAWEDKSGEENNICGFGLRPFFSKAVWDRVVASPDGLAEVRKLFDPCHIGHNKSACHSGEHIDHDGDSVMI